MAALFGLASPRVFLDTNAVRDFFRQDRELSSSDLAALRDRVSELTEARTLRLTMTQPILWELANIVTDQAGGPLLYEQTLRFYVSTAHRWLMLHEHERIRLEMKLRRALTDDEVFVDHEDPEALVRSCLAPDWVEQKCNTLRTETAGEREREASMRLSAVAGLAERVANWREDLDSHLSGRRWDATVSGYVRTEMRLWARKNRLRMSGAQWPHPTAARTIWFSESFYASKARRVFLDSPRQLTSRSSLQEMPSLIDATHFRDCAYADVFVTRDEGLRLVASGARTSLVVTDFEHFAREVLGTGGPR